MAIRIKCCLRETNKLFMTYSCQCNIVMIINWMPDSKVVNLANRLPRIYQGIEWGLDMMVLSNGKRFQKALFGVTAASSFLFVTNSSTFAETIGDAHLASGNDLLSFCASPSALQQSACLGYIVGISDAVINTDIAGKAGAKRSCASKSVSGGDRAGKVVSWLGQHTERLNETAATLVLAALIKAYPCTK